MLVYNKISNYEDEIFNCCDPDNGNENPGADCCYDAWVKELVTVTADYKEKNALVTQKQTEYNLAVDWKTKLKAWCDDWETTDEKADALCRQLELFIKHLTKVCKITEKTIDAIEILFCMTEDLYKRVDKLKLKFDQLMVCINCLMRPELAPGVGIMKCIEEYGKKLDAVIAGRDLLLGNIIKALELAMALHINICDEYGLKAELIYWKQKLNCDGSASSDNSNSYGDRKQTLTQTGSGDRICVLEPQISFPLDADGYYIDLTTQCANTKAEVEKLKTELDKAKHERDGLQACKQSLEKAIEEVKNKCN
jgi:hypothetical protein